jgi:hypothetical protein
LKKLIIYALVAYGVWSYYQKNIAPAQLETQAAPQETKTYPQPVIAITPSTSSAKPTKPARNFSCDGRQYCSQMRSKAEAEYFVRNCPNTKMDGDHDGIPCENDSRF